MVAYKGAKAEVNEIIKLILFLVSAIIVIILIIPYIISMFLKSVVSEGTDVISDAGTKVVQFVSPISETIAHRVVVPTVTAISHKVYPEGVKWTIGDTEYGIFAAPPDPIKYVSAMDEAEYMIRSGKGIVGADGMTYYDVVIDNRTTRFILQWDGKIAPVSLPYGESSVKIDPRGFGGKW